MIQSVLFWGLCVQFLLPVRIIATQSSRKANILVHLTRCTTLTGEDLGYYEQFLGIPYAQPPIGALRFNDPLPAPLWIGNQAALNKTLHCLQCCEYENTPISGTEDCLYLNVYRPKSWRKKPRPMNIIVFVQGAVLYDEFKNPITYGPEYLMATQQVILVTLSYRTNVFGFLATGDAASTGNYGFKDLVMALTWIQENIGAFGGDPNQVTLLGHGAGSVAVHYLLLSNLSEGLFKNAIMLSGVIPSPRSVPMRNPRDILNRHARELGISEPKKLSSKELVDIFRQVPANELLKALSKVTISNPGLFYGPSIESKGSVRAFITEDPWLLLQRGDFHKVPIMTSIVPWDALHNVLSQLTEDDSLANLSKDIYKRLPMILDWDFENPRMREIVEMILFKYFGKTDLMEETVTLQGLFKLANDFFYARPLFKALTLMSRNSNKAVYGFEWGYIPENSMSKIFFKEAALNGKTAAVHGDELKLIMRVNEMSSEPLNKHDSKAQKVLMGNILKFAKYDCPRFEPWSGDNPKLSVFRNENRTGIARDFISIQRWRKDMEFWEYMEKLYAEGRCVPT